MDEAEYCHRLALMYRGKIIALGTPAELKRVARVPSSAAPGYIRTLVGSMKALDCLDGVSDVAVFGGGLHVTVADPQKSIPEIWSALGQAGITVSALEQIQPSMEDVFVAMIEQEDRKAA